MDPQYVESRISRHLHYKAAAAGIPLVLASHKRAAHAYLNISKRILGQRVPLLRIR